MSELTDIPQWAFDRAMSLGRPNAKSISPSWYHTFARYIAEHEQPPVDPLVLVARETAARICEQQGKGLWAAEWRAGTHDDTIATIVACLRPGTEIGRAG